MKNCKEHRELHLLKAEVQHIIGQNEEEEDVQAFEEVLESIGSRGMFQRRLNIVFTCVASCLNLTSLHAFYLAMQTPDHWCHVPGRENTSFSMEEWKNITIPREGQSFAKCLMYNSSDVAHDVNANIIPCQYGWEYDDTWFSMTIPSQMNWVCNNTQPIIDVMFYAQNIGVALGLLLGYIGDTYGRRPLLFICLASHVVSRLLIILAPHLLVVFILAESLVSAAAGPMYESALSVGLELTDIRHRTVVNMAASCSTSVAMIFAGLLGWALASWNSLLSAVAGCCFAVFFFHRWFPESPRWLACRGRLKEAMALLVHIAHINGGSVPAFTKQVLQRVAQSKTEKMGFLSLFSRWVVFKNTVLLIIARAVYLLTLFTALMAAGSLSGNPFLSVAVQGAAQLPAFCAVSYCASRFGRRWTAVSAPLLSALGAAAIVAMFTANISGVGPTLMAMVVQLGTTASSAMCNLQSVEVHPTCLRQIAACVEWAIAGVILSTLPYVVLTGSSIDIRFPFTILAAINIFAAFALSFLPESAMKGLPETMQDAAVFGKGQLFWSWKPKPSTRYSEKLLSS